jgi:hypothetical protein
MTMLLQPASESDIPDIKDLCKGIWDGGDYLPLLIARWITEGGVYVGLVDGEIIGVSRVRKMAEDEWWLEGLRIAVGCQGHGYGRELHNLTLEELKRIARGTVRFASADTNRSIPPALKSGFREILRLPFTYAELPYHKAGKHARHSLLMHNNSGIITEVTPQVRKLVKEACAKDYAGLIRQGWEFYNFSEERLTLWLQQSIVLAAYGEDGIKAAAVLSTDYQRPGNLDLNAIAGDDAAVREQLIPSLVAAVKLQPERYREIYVCVPERYRDVLTNTGFQGASFFHDQIVFEAEIDKLVPANSK